MGKIKKLQVNKNIEKETKSNFALTSENVGYTNRIKKLRVSKKIEKNIGRGFALTSAGFVGASATLIMFTSESILVPSIVALGCASLSCLFYGASILSDMQINCNEILIGCNKRIISCNETLEKPKTFVKNNRIS